MAIIRLVTSLPVFDFPPHDFATHVSGSSAAVNILKPRHSGAYPLLSLYYHVAMLNATISAPCAQFPTSPTHPPPPRQRYGCWRPAATRVPLLASLGGYSRSMRVDGHPLGFFQLSAVPLLPVQFNFSSDFRKCLGLQATSGMVASRPRWLRSVALLR